MQAYHFVDADLGRSSIKVIQMDAISALACLLKFVYIIFSYSIDIIIICFC